jgi:hypothetical protein
MRHDRRNHGALHDSNQSQGRKEEEMSMSTKPRKNSSTKLQAGSPDGDGTGEDAVGNSSRDEEIRRRAYEVYLERGEQSGTEQDDWLQAERELEAGALSRSKLG